MISSNDSGLVHYFNTFVKWNLVLMMMAIAALTFYQVITRYVFNNASSWSEEVIRFIFIWCSFIGAAIGLREGIHIGINIFVNLLPRKLIPLTEIVVNIAIIVFAGYIVYYGWQTTVMADRQLSPALGIPMSWVYLSMPVMGAMTIFYCSLNSIESWRRFTALRSI
jgi:TRAP-type C4-dicarboxylate transport system permease small subunit